MEKLVIIFPSWFFAFEDARCDIEQSEDWKYSRWDATIVIINEN